MAVGIEHLSWDSSFFNLKVGKALVLTKDGLTQALESGRKDGYDLVYAFCKEEQAATADTPLLDIKINSTLKYQHKGLETNPQIREVYEAEHEEALKSLVLKNGVHTRFYKDEKLKSHYTNLYLKWLERCTQFDTRRTWFYEENNELLGFVTLAVDGVFQVELCSVVEEHRSKGIARSLWMHMFEVVSQEEEAVFHISYQGLNDIGHRFYQSLGFQENERFYIYHLWP